jgi:hypothetical protein
MTSRGESHVLQKPTRVWRSPAGDHASPRRAFTRGPDDAHPDDQRSAAGTDFVHHDHLQRRPSGAEALDLRERLVANVPCLPGLRAFLRHPLRLPLAIHSRPASCERLSARTNGPNRNRGRESSFSMSLDPPILLSLKVNRAPSLFPCPQTAPRRSGEAPSARTLRKPAWQSFRAPGRRWLRVKRPGVRRGPRCTVYRLAAVLLARPRIMSHLHNCS